VTLVASRRAGWRHLVGSAIFALVGLGALLSGNGALWAWAAVVFFGVIGVPFFILQLTSNHFTLELDRDGFRTTGLGGYNQGPFRWSDASPFRIIVIGLNLYRVGCGLASGKRMIFPGKYEGLSVRQLRDLMNEWREFYGVRRAGAR
jgi:hypothetical protein